MAHLKLFVFGQPRLEYGGKPIELNLRKALALLVYLAASGRPHNRDALATLLWPESDQIEGRACVAPSTTSMQRQRVTTNRLSPSTEN